MAVFHQVVVKDVCVQLGVIGCFVLEIGSVQGPLKRMTGRSKESTKNGLVKVQEGFAVVGCDFVVEWEDPYSLHLWQEMGQEEDVIDARGASDVCVW